MHNFISFISVATYIVSYACSDDILMQKIECIKIMLQLGQVANISSELITMMMQYSK